MTSGIKPGSTPQIDQCIAQARGGSGDALGQVFELCRDYLIVIAREEMDPDLRAKAGASDIVQETFLDAQRAFARFRGRTEAELLGWLREILRCHMANLRRQYHDTAKRDVARESPLAADEVEGVLPLAGSPSSSLTPSWQVISREEVERVEVAVLRLPVDYRQIIMLVSRQHHTFAEAGAAMGRSADAARRLWGRAIEKLAAELQAHHDERRASAK